MAGASAGTDAPIHTQVLMQPTDRRGLSGCHVAQSGGRRAAAKHTRSHMIAEKHVVPSCFRAARGLLFQQMGALTPQRNR